MRYCVLDNGRPASVEGFPGLVGWKQHRFETYAEALGHAIMWLGDDTIPLPLDWDGAPFDYNSHGDMIQIREEGE